MTISRRKFFSFFGTGVALLAKPDLFLPVPAKVTPVHFSWDPARQGWIWWTPDCGVRWLPYTAIKVGEPLKWVDP